MLRSLRTRLTLLFAGTLLLATVIAGAASIRLYQSYNRDQTASELRSQVGGAAQYFDAALNAFGHGSQHTPTRATVSRSKASAAATCSIPATCRRFPAANKLISFAGKGVDWQTMQP